MHGSHPHVTVRHISRVSRFSEGTRARPRRLASSWSGCRGGPSSVLSNYLLDHQPFKIGYTRGHGYWTLNSPGKFLCHQPAWNRFTSMERTLLHQKQSFQIVGFKSSWDRKLKWNHSAWNALRYITLSPQVCSTYSEHMREPLAGTMLQSPMSAQKEGRRKGILQGNF